MVTTLELKRSQHRSRHNHHNRIVLSKQFSYEIASSHIGIDYQGGGGRSQFFFPESSDRNGQAHFSEKNGKPLS